MNYIINIKTGAIHKENANCQAYKRMKEANKQFCCTLDEAINYYEGNEKKGEKCTICFKNEI